MTAVPKTRWATTEDGASIAYQVLGQGDQTIVVIHPWASHLEVYWEQPRFARFMRRLSRGLRVVHMDKRGWGMSDRIFGTPDVSLLMDDVRAVMDASGTKRAAVFGWGAGRRSARRPLRRHVPRAHFGAPARRSAPRALVRGPPRRRHG